MLCGAIRTLRRAYESEKERIIGGGTTDSLEYCYAKGEFITQGAGDNRQTLK